MRPEQSSRKFRYSSSWIWLKVAEIAMLFIGAREQLPFGGGNWSLSDDIFALIIIAAFALILLEGVWFVLMPYVRITPSDITVFPVAHSRQTNTWNAIKEIRRVKSEKIELHFYGGDKIALDLSNLSGSDQVLLEGEIERLSRVPMTDAPPRRSKLAALLNRQI